MRRPPWGWARVVRAAPWAAAMAATMVPAGIGVFSTLPTQARERDRDLGIHKAVGMTPRQVITMVTCWAVAPAIIAAAIALPAGAALEPVVARAVVSAQAGPAENITPLHLDAPGGAAQNAPPPGQDPYTPGELALLALAGLPGPRQSR